MLFSDESRFFNVRITESILSIGKSLHIKGRSIPRTLDVNVCLGVLAKTILWSISFSVLIADQYVNILKNTLDNFLENTYP